MRKLLTAISFVSSTLAFAYEPSIPQGSFHIGEKWTQLTAYRVEAVLRSTNAGAARIRQLRGEGYFCDFAGGNFVRCKKFIPREAPAVADVQRKWDDLKELKVVFAPTHSVKPVYQSELFAEYEVIQKVQGQKTYNDYRYLASVSQEQMVEKIQLLEGEELREEYLVEGQDKLALVVTLQKTLGTFSYEERLLKFPLIRE